MVRRYRAVGDEYAQDLLQNAIGDTFRGVLAWDPTQVDLERHLWNAIRARSHCDYKRAKRFRHERAEIGDSKLSHLEAHDVQREELRQRARCVLVELRELAAGDPIVLLLLAAYEEGVIHRGPVLEHTGITPHQYEAARDRLARLRDDLPHHLAP